MPEHPHGRDRYLELPKSYGEVDFDTLLSYARKYELDEQEAASVPTKATFANRAASAFIEAALVLDDPLHDHDDYRLGLLDDGQAAFERVIGYENTLLETGQKSPDDQEAVLRADLHAAFYNVYGDMICGELTEDTKQELIGYLNKQIHLTDRLYRDLRGYHGYMRKKLSGLNSELRLLLDSWQKYQIRGDTIAIPASDRGDNGVHNKTKTHDIAYLTQLPDSTFELTGNEEVKTKSQFLQNNLGYLIRYDSSIATVDKSGTITRY